MFIDRKAVGHASDVITNFTLGVKH